MLLTHVSKRWRWVAHEHAVLWTWVKAEVPPSGTYLEDRFACISTAVSRAGSMPLHLQILARKAQNRHKDGRFDRSELREETIALYPENSGWSDATLDEAAPNDSEIHLGSSCPDSSDNTDVAMDPSPFRFLAWNRLTTVTDLTLTGIPFASLQGLPPGLFRALQRLILECLGPTRTPGIAKPLTSLSTIRAFEDAPSLCRVAIGNWTMGTREADSGSYSLHRLVLPLAQLTHFLEASCRPGGTRFFPEFFSQCSQLTYLAIRLDKYQVGTWWEDSWVHGATQTKLQSDTLKTLNISFWRNRVGRMAYPGFWDYVEFPALENLLLDGSTLCFDSDWSAVQVDRFLAKLRSLHNLRYLSITATWAETSTLGRILRATPQITTLDAHIYCNFASFFQVLNNKSSSRYADVLPNLEVLVLELGLSNATDSFIGSTINKDMFYSEFIVPRVMCTSERRRLRTIVLYANKEEQIADLGYMRILRECVSRGLISLEIRLVGQERCITGKSGNYWIERDPELKDWPQVTEYNN